MLRDWKRIAVDAVAGATIGPVIGYVAAMIGAAIAAWWGTPSNYSRLDFLFVFFSIAITLAVIWVLVAFGWRWVFPIPPQPQPAAQIPLSAPAATQLDLAPYRERDRLEIYVIACLSVGVEPSLEAIHAGEANSRLRYLDDAIRDGALKTVRGDITVSGGENGIMVQVLHHDLRKFAEMARNDELLRFIDEWRPRLPGRPDFSPKERDRIGDFLVEVDDLLKEAEKAAGPVHNFFYFQHKLGHASQAQEQLRVAASQMNDFQEKRMALRAKMMDMAGDKLAAAMHDTEPLSELVGALNTISETPTPLEQRALFKFLEWFRLWMGRTEEARRLRKREINA